MPITLDASLDPALYPLAWLLGTWRGDGAVALADEDGEDAGRRIEQEVSAEAAEGGTLAWRMRTWVLDAPPPVPPTAAFTEAAEQPAAAEPTPTGPAERTLLVEESGTWRVGDPLPGQDLEAAANAKPGSPEAVVSYALEATITSDDGRREVYVGEVRGPRIQLATQSVEDASTTPHVLAARRMFGYVGGRLMWVLDRMTESTPMASYLSAELDRADGPASAEEGTGGSADEPLDG